MKHVIYLHGLNSSHHSFGYLIKSFPEHNHVLIDYSSHQPLGISIAHVISQLPKTGELVLVGHSLGGVIAALIAESDDRVVRLATISSPFNGSRAASTLRWLPGAPLIMRDILPRGVFMSRCAEMKLRIPTLNIVSTGGHIPTSPEPNDSVVTISSQKALNFGKKVEIKANHFEVLMHEKTASLLSDFIFKEEGLLNETNLEARP